LKQFKENNKVYFEKSALILEEEFLVGRLEKLFHHCFFSYFSKCMGIQQEGEIAEESEVIPIAIKYQIRDSVTSCRQLTPENS
jgi:hypothetical protein